MEEMTCTWVLKDEINYASMHSDFFGTDWFQIGKGVRQGCILSPFLLNLYAESSVSHDVLCI